MLIVLLFALLYPKHVSANELYVSEDCTESVPTPCNSLSGYLESASLLDGIDDVLIYFTEGNHILDTVLDLRYPRNLTMQGLSDNVGIFCSDEGGISITKGSYIKFSRISFHNCEKAITMTNSTDLTFTDISVHEFDFYLFNCFDVLVSYSAFHGSDVTFEYDYHEVSTGSNESQLYYLNVTDLTVNAFTPDSGLFLSVYHEESYFLAITLENIVIQGNSATSNNSALGTWYALYSLRITNMTSTGGYAGFGITFHFDADLVLNSTSLPSGISPTDNSREMIIIEDCYFNNNQYGFAIIGTTDTIFTSNQVIHIKSSIISGNRRAGLAIGFDDGITRAAESIITIMVSDLHLLNNERNIIASYDNAILSNVTITGTRFTGLTLIQSHVTVVNSLNLFNNNGVNGGAMSLSGSSQLILRHGSLVNITGNRASSKGGGLYHNFLSLSALEIHTFPKIDATVYFSNNSAGIVAHDIYNVPLLCQYYKCVSNGSRAAVSISTDTLEMCFCNESFDYNSRAFNYSRDCSKSIPKQRMFPGQRVKFSVLMLGLDINLRHNSITNGLMQITLNDDPASTREMFIDANCSTRYYSYASNLTENKLEVKNRFSSLFTELLQPSTFLTFNFTVAPCPVGFSLTSEGACNCSSGLRRGNVTCDIDTLTISHTGQRWIGSYNTTLANASQEYPNTCLISEPCFFHCTARRSTFMLNDTNAQCINNRGGRLCGGCREGYSLLMGSNRCGKCDNSYIMIGWIALFAVMGILLVAMLIVLNLTVAGGTLNGLLFYANMFKLYEQVFSSLGVSPFLSQIISWINLDFGIESCLYKGMDRYGKDWLQFVFPAYLWLIIIIIILLGRGSNRVSRLVSTTRNAVPVLATLMLLSYTKLVRTVISILFRRKVTLYCTDDTVKSLSLWFGDSTLDYATGKHGALFALAVLVIVCFIVPYTVFLLFNQLFEKYVSGFKYFARLWNYMKPVIDAYCGPLKDNYRFWPGLFIAARLPVLIFVSLVDDFGTDRSLLLGGLLGIVVILFSLAYSFGGVYRKGLHNVIESWFLLNLCLIVALSVAYPNGSGEWINVFVVVFELSLLGIILYHLHLKLSTYAWYVELLKRIDKGRKDFLKRKAPAADAGALKVQDEGKEEFELGNSNKKMVTTSVIELERCDRESVTDLFVD